ncbi:MAG: LmbE family N-acetylglucosaminyl deacetylase [Planctomycetota bacterium]|jgi:LmbE family N-acetylglucosaminyl deacetylase
MKITMPDASLSRSLLTLQLLFLVACVSGRDPDRWKGLDKAPIAPGRVFLNMDEEGAGPRVLAVVAHPDDETVFAATLFKLSSHLDATCDLLTITNGEGGFKYSTLAEGMYGLELTEESVGRAHLPKIRREELLEGCSYLGLRSVEFLLETDHRYTQDPSEVLGEEAEVWDLKRIGGILDGRLEAGDYDFVFTMAPTATTHGHHQAATILALQAVARRPSGQRPVILCASTRAAAEDAPLEVVPLEGYPETATTDAQFSFDRSQGFGYRGKLTYQVIVNWVIAAHKSQGTMQLAMNLGVFEDFSLFELNDEGAEQRARELFDALQGEQFPAKEYGPSAGAVPIPRKP